MLTCIGDSLSNIPSSDNVEDGKDEGDDEQATELGKPSEDDEHGWAMATISKTSKQWMGSIPQRQMRLDELMQPGCGDMVNYFCERDMKYGMAELKDPVVVTNQANEA